MAVARLVASVMAARIHDEDWHPSRLPGALDLPVVLVDSDRGVFGVVLITDGVRELLVLPRWLATSELGGAALAYGCALAFMAGQPRATPEEDRVWYTAATLSIPDWMVRAALDGPLSVAALAERYDLPEPFVELRCALEPLGDEVRGDRHHLQRAREAMVAWRAYLDAAASGREMPRGDPVWGHG
jgi:hypothetical protein